MKKLCFYAAALLCLPAFLANAQLTNITASHTSMGGVLIPSGKVNFTPVDANGKPISFSQGGGGLNGPTAFPCALNSGAIIGTCAIPDAALTLPANICYSVIVTRATPFASFTLPKVCGITGSSWSLDAYAPPAQTSSTQALIVGYLGTANPPNPCSNATMYIQNVSGGVLWICVAGVPVKDGGNSAALTPSAIQFGTSASTTRAALGDVDFQSVSSTPSGGSQGSLQVIANAVVDQNLASFTDRTPYWCPGPAYCSTGIFSEDYTYALIQNPSKFTGAYGSPAIRNIVAKFIAAADGHGQIPAAINAAGTTSVAYSSADANQVFYSGVSWAMLPLLCYEDYLKTGQTTCYTSSVAAIKTAQQYFPRNGSTHLPTVVVGANEYVAGSLFLELPRFSGDVGNASVLLAASDAVMLKMATAAGDATNVTYFNTELGQVTASINANLIDPTSHMLWGATGQDKQIDTLSSAFAVWFSNWTGTNIITPTQQAQIGTFLHTNLASMTYNGYFANTVNSSGTVISWATQGQIPSGGGGSGYTAMCSGSTTTYQNGYWSLGFAGAALALNKTNPSDIPTLLASFRDSATGSVGDPGVEYYTQAHAFDSGSCNTATTPNLESPQGAAWVAANLVGPTPVAAGLGTTNKYGAIVTGAGAVGITNPFPVVTAPQTFQGNSTTAAILGVQNTNVGGASSFTFIDNTGFQLAGAGYANAGFPLAYLRGATYLFGGGTNGVILTGNVGAGAGLRLDSSNNVFIPINSYLGAQGFAKGAPTVSVNSYDNGTSSTPQHQFYYGNNQNFSFDSTPFAAGGFGNCSGQIYRWVHNAYESGGAVIGCLDGAGNLSIAGGFRALQGLGPSAAAQWNSGTADPSGACTTGALFSNTSGAAGHVFWVCIATAWVDIK